MLTTVSHPVPSGSNVSCVARDDGWSFSFIGMFVGVGVEQQFSQMKLVNLETFDQSGEDSEGT